MSNKISTGQQVYKAGDIIDLMLEIDDSLVSSQGTTIPIKILDKYNNTIGQVTAEQLDGNLYIAEYSIPYNLQDLYNINEEEDTNEYFYELLDTWQLTSGAVLSYAFSVYKLEAEQPVLDNHKLTISLSGILDINANIIEDTVLEFTTALYPYYGNVDSVRSFKRDELIGISNFDIARDIMEWSRYVELHMKPDIIYYQEQYDNAVIEYVNATVSKYLLIPILNTNSESKELDSFKISRSSGGADYVISKLDELITKYEAIIYSGGRDAFFLPTLFTKGLNDPNRPNVSRSNLNISDNYPWVNTTTNTYRIEIDGQEMEIRGTRSITFKSISRLPPAAITRLNETSF